MLLLRARIELARNRPDKAPDPIGRCSEAIPRERHTAAVLRLAAQLAMRRGDVAWTGMDVVKEFSDACGPWLGLLMLPEPDLLRIKLFLAQAGMDLGRVMEYGSPLPGYLSTVSLTDRERVICSELASTGNAAHIGQRQFVSVITLTSQRRGSYRKLGVCGRVAGQ